MWNSLVRKISGCRQNGYPGGRSAAEKLLGAGDVVLGNLDSAGHPTGDLGGLLLEVVALAGLLAKDLAGAGHAEALAGTGVALVLRHLLVSLFFLLVSLRCRSRDRGSRSGHAPSWPRPGPRQRPRRARRARRPPRPRARRCWSPWPPVGRPSRRPSSCSGRGP